MPRIRAVTSMWKKVSAVIRMIVPNRKIQTGIESPVHASMVVTAKYDVTPVTAEAKTR